MAPCYAVLLASVHWIVWAFFGLVGALWVNGLVAFGLYSGIQMGVASRLPAGNFIRECIVHPDVMLGRLQDAIADNPNKWAVRLFVISYFGGGFLFSIFESKVSYFDGLWWAHVTMYTVGYGDLSPERWLMRILAMGVISSGYWSLAILQSSLTGRISARQTERRLRRVIEGDGTYHDDIEKLCSELESSLSVLRAIGTGLRERETNTKGGRP